MVKRDVTIKLQGQEFKIGFPNMGQIVDIEVMKVSYSKNQYQGLVLSSTKSSFAALDFIDAISTFLVLIPELNKNLNIEDIMSLDPIQAQELVVQYKRVFFPWYDEIIEGMKVKESELSKIYETPEPNTKESPDKSD